MSQERLSVVPANVASVNRLVRQWHRHHGDAPPALAYFGLAVVKENGEVCGAALVGRPANRNSDHSQIGEVLRVVTDGTPNACSALLGAAARAARALGFSRLMTYTLESESGTSLKAVGWKREVDGVESWWHRYPEKNAADRRTVVERPHHGEQKVRWAIDLREPRPVRWPESEAASAAVPFDFGGAA